MSADPSSYWRWRLTLAFSEHGGRHSFTPDSPCWLESCVQSICVCMSKNGQIVFGLGGKAAGKSGCKVFKTQLLSSKTNECSANDAKQNLKQCHQKLLFDSSPLSGLCLVCTLIIMCPPNSEVLSCSHLVQTDFSEIICTFLSHICTL